MHKTVFGQERGQRCSNSSGERATGKTGLSSLGLESARDRFLRAAGVVAGVSPQKRFANAAVTIVGAVPAATDDHVGSVPLTLIPIASK